MPLLEVLSPWTKASLGEFFGLKCEIKYHCTDPYKALTYLQRRGVCFGGSSVKRGRRFRSLMMSFFTIFKTSDKDL